MKYLGSTMAGSVHKEVIMPRLVVTRAHGISLVRRQRTYGCYDQLIAAVRQRLPRCIMITMCDAEK